MSTQACKPLEHTSSATYLNTHAFKPLEHTSMTKRCGTLGRRLLGHTGMPKQTNKNGKTSNIHKKRQRGAALFIFCGGAAEPAPPGVRIALLSSRVYHFPQLQQNGWQFTLTLYYISHLNSQKTPGGRCQGYSKTYGRPTARVGQGIQSRLQLNHFEEGLGYGPGSTAVTSSDVGWRKVR